MGVTIGVKESKSLPDQPQVTSYTTTSAGQTEAKMKKKSLSQILRKTVLMYMKKGKKKFTQTGKPSFQVKKLLTYLTMLKRCTQKLLTLRESKKTMML